MNLSSLEATFEANKTPILAAAGAGVVGLGLYAKKKKAAAGGGAAATVGGASSGGQTAGMTGGAAYDSSASDLYGAIQPQLESLGGQLTDLRNLYGSSSSSGTPPTPVPAPTPDPTPAPTGPAVSYSSSTPTPVPAVQYNVGAFGNYTTPTTGVQGPIGSAVYDTSGQTIGAVSSYTFNGLPNVNYSGNVSLAQATSSAGQGGAPVWTKQSNGSYANQWGNVAKSLDQYGTPVF